MLAKNLLRPSGRSLQAALFTRPFATQAPPPSEPSTIKTTVDKKEEKAAKPPPSTAATKQSKESEQEKEAEPVKPWPLRLDDTGEKFRLPRSVQALYLRPLRRTAEHGLPVCDLQLRSYSVRNLEFFADFAIRAAYYLKLPVSGPVPLPRIVERWTVPRSNFIHKKSQENFERITLRRLIQIKDGHQDSVQLWLAFLRRHAFYGVGMKANVWDFDDLDVAGGLDAAAEDVNKTLEPYFAQFGQRKGAKETQSVGSYLNSERFSNLQSPLNEVRKG